MTRTVHRFVLTGLLIAGCSSSSEALTSPASTTSEAAKATTTPAQTTPVTSPVTSLATDPAIDTVVSGPPSTVTSPANTTDITPPTCAPTPAPIDGTVTFVAGGYLYEIGDESETCLFALDAKDAGPIRWSPNGEHVLLGGATVADSASVRPSGYFAENRNVTWSAPTGKALIAPSVKDGTLVWRSSTDAASRLDVSFLSDTTAADYHPAGRGIVAAGIDENGGGGIFLASNRGENRQTLATFDATESNVSDVAFDQRGTRVYFLHHHTNGDEHVHYVGIPGLELTTLVQSTRPTSHLTMSLVDDQAAAWQVDNGDGTTAVGVALGDTVSTVDLGTGADHVMEPVGWLSGERLVVLQRDRGDHSGSGTLWVWTSGSATQLADGVERAAVRVIRGDYDELPTEIAQQAPG